MFDRHGTACTDVYKVVCERHASLALPSIATVGMDVYNVVCDRHAWAGTDVYRVLRRGVICHQALNH